MWHNHLIGNISPQCEQYKFAILRIVIGVVISGRLLLNLVPASVYYDPTTILGMSINTHLFFDLLLLFLATAFTTGLCTNLCTLCLLIGLQSFDVYCGVLSLGTTILSGLLCFLLLVNCGLKLSIDSLILQGSTKLLKQFISWQRNLVGVPTKFQISVFQLCLFIQYGLTSFGAMLIHLQDPYWQTGKTIKTLLTSSYLCHQFALFRWIEWQYPTGFDTFSMLAGIAQSIFQIGMIPLALLSRQGKTIVYLWGSAFFLISLFCLQLSYLPFVEIIIWMAIFWHPKFTDFSAAIRSKRTPRALFAAEVCIFIVLSTGYLSGFQLIKQVQPFSSLATLFQPAQSLMWNLGFCCPNVFNKSDLALSNHWYCLRRGSPYGTLVPINGKVGERLWYHYFDVVYFSNSLVWRRCSSSETFRNSALNRQLITRIARLDQRLTGFQDAYFATTYESDQSDVEKSRKQRYEPRLVDTFEISVRGCTSDQ